MSCDELVSLLESNGADGGFLESVLSYGTTGAEFKDMLVSAGTAQEVVQLFASITDMEPFKIATLWSRARAETTGGQASGEKPRATDPDDHAVKREEDEPEGRSIWTQKSSGPGHGPGRKAGQALVRSRGRC